MLSSASVYSSQLLTKEDNILNSCLLTEFHLLFALEEAWGECKEKADCGNVIKDCIIMQTHKGADQGRINNLISGVLLPSYTGFATIVVVYQRVFRRNF